jgi:hypothetical protein
MRRLRPWPEEADESDGSPSQMRCTMRRSKEESERGNASSVRAPSARNASICPCSSPRACSRGTRRVRLVRGEGRGVSD